MRKSSFVRRLPPFFLFLLSLAATFLILLLIPLIYQPPRTALLASGPMRVGLPPQSPQDERQEIISATTIWKAGLGDAQGFKPGAYRFSFTVNLEGPTDAGWLMVFPRTDGNALSLSLSGQEIGSRGDMVAGNSNIWNSAKIFSVPSSLLGRENAFDLDIYGVYEAGIRLKPYLIQRDKGAAHIFFLGLISDYGIWALCGALFAIGIIISLTGLSISTHIDGRVLLGIACLLSGLFLMDFLSLDYLPMGLLALKKILAAARHLAMAVSTLAIVRLLSRRLDWFSLPFTALQLACAIVVFTARTMADLKLLYQVTYLSVFPFPLYFLALVYSKLKGEHQNGDQGVATGRDYYLLFGCCVALLCALHDITPADYRLSPLSISHLGFFLLFVSLTAFVVSDILHHYRMIIIERGRAAMFKEEALRDPLTECFNRRVFPFVQGAQRIHGHEKQGLSAIMVDLNEFKQINDSYGHRIGDLVLRDMACILKKRVRSDDFVVRDGGDEFLVLLPGCPQEKLADIVKIILEDLEKACIPLDEDLETGKRCARRYSASLGWARAEAEELGSLEALESLIAKADAAMYQEKMKA